MALPAGACRIHRDDGCSPVRHGTWLNLGGNKHAQPPIYTLGSSSAFVSRNAQIRPFCTAQPRRVHHRGAAHTGVGSVAVSDRELVVLGTASQAPTRSRNHNGYLLLWDDEGLLFDPGEGTQRQMLFAGVTASRITRICITHFHGDHCLGLPGVLARMSLDRVPHAVDACYPAQNQEVFARLRHAALFRDAVDLREQPAEAAGPVLRAAAFHVEARPLSHTIPALGYRLVEADGRRMLPDRLAAFGITGPDIGRLQREGRLVTGERLVTVDQVSEPRRGQRFAFIMDTRLCDAAFELADGADMVVCESTFADTEAGLAREYGHLTARQAGRIAAESRARLLVLTHFSQRYEHGDGQQLAAQAAMAFGGPVVLAHDLERIPVPSRHPSES
jgi:ribonuclease Z